MHYTVIILRWSGDCKPVMTVASMSALIDLRVQGGFVQGSQGEARARGRRPWDHGREAQACFNRRQQESVGPLLNVAK